MYVITCFNISEYVFGLKIILEIANGLPNLQLPNLLSNHMLEDAKGYGPKKLLLISILMFCNYGSEIGNILGKKDASKMSSNNL